MEATQEVDVRLLVKLQLKNQSLLRKTPLNRSSPKNQAAPLIMKPLKVTICTQQKSIKPTETANTLNRAKTYT